MTTQVICARNESEQLLAKKLYRRKLVPICQIHGPENENVADRDFIVAVETKAKAKQVDNVNLAFQVVADIKWPEFAQSATKPA